MAVKSNFLSVVRNGTNGLLVPPKDVSALVNALELLIKDPGMRHEVGACGRTIAIEEFSERKVVQETLNVYEELHV